MRKIQIGSVSTGTLRTEDLLPAFADELSVMEMSETGVKLLREVEDFLGAPNDSFLLFPSFGTLPDWESEKAGFLMDELFDALNEYAPPHMQFGAHDGDGADFGWWPTDFENCHTVSIDQGKNGEGTFIDTECNLYVETNDHGNMTVKELGGAVIWDCV